MSEIIQAVETEHIEKQPVSEELSEIIKSCSDERVPEPLVDYLVGKRNLPMDTVVDLYNRGQIGYNKHKSKPCVMFKFSDSNDEEDALQYRTMDDSLFPGINEKVKFGKGEKSTGKFFMAGDRLNHKTVVFCESPINAMSIAGTCPNVLAIAIGSAGHTHKIKLLLQHLYSNINIVCFFDNDISGQSATQETANVFDRTVKSIRWQEGTPDGHDSNHLLQAGNPGQIRDMIANAVIVERTNVVELGAVAHDNGWEAPMLFNDTHVDPIPVRYFPPILQNFIKTLSDFTQTSSEIAMALVLATIGAIAGSKFYVVIREGYAEPIIAYMIAVAASGERKTPVFKLCMDPVMNWQKKQLKKYKVNIAKALEANSVYQKKIEKLKQTVKAESTPSEIEKINDDISKTMDLMYQIPVIPRILTEDATPEAFIEQIAKQPSQQLSLFSDEGGVFKVISGLYSNGKSQFDIFLKGYSGAPYTKDRVGKPPVHIDAAHTSVGLTVQPGVMKSVNDIKAFKDTGMIARFKILQAEKRIGKRSPEAPCLDKDAVSAYNETVTSLLDMKWKTKDGQKSLDSFQPGDAIPYEMKFTPEAYELYKRHFTDIESQVCEDGELEYAEDFTGKLPGSTVRLAGMFQLFSEGPLDLKIQQQILQDAIDLNAHFTKHTLAAMNVMQADSETQDAMTMWEWIERQIKAGKRIFSWRQIQQGTKHRINIGHQKIAFQVLIDRYYVRGIIDPVQTRTKTFEVNPELIK